MGSGKMFSVKNTGVNTHPTSGAGALGANLKATGYEGRSQGNAAAKTLSGLKNIKPLGAVQHSAATNAPGPKKV